MFDCYTEIAKSSAMLAILDERFLNLLVDHVLLSDKFGPAVLKAIERDERHKEAMKKLLASCI